MPADTQAPAPCRCAGAQAPAASIALLTCADLSAALKIHRGTIWRLAALADAGLPCGGFPKPIRAENRPLASGRRASVSGRPGGRDGAAMSKLAPISGAEFFLRWLVSWILRLTLPTPLFLRALARFCRWRHRRLGR